MSILLSKTTKFFQKSLLNYEIKNLWAYVAVAFNKVDADRLKLVGPDRMCAEWVLKNSGAISSTAFAGKFLRDYNSLPPENVKFAVKEIDGTNSTIMGIGFDHLKNCNKIDRIILKSCKHLESDSLGGLENAKASLQILEISECNNLQDESFLPLKSLTNLKLLKMSNLQYVKDLNGVANDLRKSLPNCNIEIT